MKAKIEPLIRIKKFQLSKVKARLLKSSKQLKTQLHWQETLQAARLIYDPVVNRTMNNSSEGMRPGYLQIERIFDYEREIIGAVTAAKYELKAVDNELKRSILLESKYDEMLDEAAACIKQDIDLGDSHEIENQQLIINSCPGPLQEYYCNNLQPGDPEIRFLEKCNGNETDSDKSTENLSPKLPLEFNDSTEQRSSGHNSRFYGINENAEIVNLKLDLETTENSQDCPIGKIDINSPGEKFLDIDLKIFQQLDCIDGIRSDLLKFCSANKTKIILKIANS